ncbi:MAG TPA: phosphoheptose isomerase [Opitutaceae bacterium]
MTPPPRGRILLLPPNRVWRTYQGGMTLDALAVSAGAPLPAETAGPSHFPEDWIASTTRAVNAGREDQREGVSQVSAAGETFDFAELLAADPAYFLGAAHAAKYGAEPRLLVKLLDPAMRLHFQAHPTAAFAQRYLGSPSGKTEAYHVLATDPRIAQPYIYLGFQRPPSRAALKQLIETQDIAGIEACFDKIPVRAGDTYLVPGGVPHALGEGVFLVEIQEPSDLVVRFEFERGGYVLPEAARFMGRGLDFCLDVFDFSPWPLNRIAVEAACPPRRRRPLGPDSYQDDLIGPERTPCFGVRKSSVRAPLTKAEGGFYIGIVTAGAVTLTAGGETHRLRAFDKFFVPAGLGAVEFTPEPAAEILECFPPT